MKDSLTISHVNYQKKLVAIKDLTSNITLDKKVKQLNEVVVESKVFKTVQIGSTSTAGFLISGFSNGDLGGEVGSKIKIKRKSLIEEIGFHVHSNSFDSVRLRINIYDLNRKLPGEKISSEDFILITGKEAGFFKKKLNKLVLVQEDVIATLEMVDHFPKHKGSIYFSQTPPYVKRMYYRETSFDQVKKYIGGPMSIFINVKQEQK